MLDAPSASALSTLPGPEQEARVLEWLRDPYLPPGAPDLEAFHSHRVAPEAKGALGFYLFTQKAEQWQRTLKGKEPQASDAAEPLRAAASHLLGEIDTRLFLRRFYKYERVSEGTLSLHRTGTTSYILEQEIPLTSGRPYERLAVKIIKPRFHAARTISNQTIAAYGRIQRRQYPFVPTVYGSPEGANYVVMTFVPGKTLREAVLAERANPQFSTWAKDVLKKVCEQLALIHEKSSDCPNGDSHLDLSPDNIIVGTDRRIYLIDFGKNHLLMERVGPGSSYLQAKRYIAPELEDSADSPTADAYSLGVILIENAAYNRTDSSEIEVQLDSIREVYPRLALMLESLVDPDPTTRGLEFSRDGDIDYRAAYEQISIALDRFKERLAERKSRFVRALIAMFMLAVPNLDRLIARARELEDMPGNDTESRESYRLSAWAVVNETMHMLLMTAAAYSFNEHYRAGTLSDALPGWLVATTFAFVATKYYGNILSEISAAKISRGTDLLMRLMSFVAVGPIGWTLLVNPKDWAFCSAIGMAAVTATNYAAWRSAKRCGQEIGAITRRQLPQSHHYFVDKLYGTWWHYTGMHAILLALTGLLLLGLPIPGIGTVLLRDEAAYAFLVVVVNVLMLVYNDIRAAAAVRSGLSWSYDNFRRLKRLSEDARRSIHQESRREESVGV